MSRLTQISYIPCEYWTSCCSSQQEKCLSRLSKMLVIVLKRGWHMWSYWIQCFKS